MESKAGRGTAIGNGGNALTVGRGILRRRGLLSATVAGDGCSKTPAWNGLCHRRRRCERSSLEAEKGKNIKKIGNWDWFKNPFDGTRGLNGLRVMMALINNWDLKNVNNEVYQSDGEARYVVSDLGASFGKTGNNISRSKSNVEGYGKSKFIDKESNEEVDLEMHSRPFLPTVVNLPNYRKRTKIEEITEHIPRADARWVGQLLGQLSEEQIRDAFRSAGYTAEEVEGYTTEIRKRIAELNAL